MIHERPVLAGVVGNPVSHSLSPLVHTVWAERARIDGHYIPVKAPLSFEGFASLMDGMRAAGFSGVNVTLPHKENAYRYAGKKSAGAQAVRAANMLTFSTGETIAENSDADGFYNAVSGYFAGRPSPSRALVLGCGGAARSIVFALKEKAGCRDIYVTNRTSRKADFLVEEFSLAGSIPWEDRQDFPGGLDILVNTTSLGMTGQMPLDLDISKLGKSTVICDIVYNPLETELLEKAANAGHHTVDGLSMLMHQAVPGFKRWFGGDAVPDEHLRGILVAELERRSRS